jgi:hypothetical protein
LEAQYGKVWNTQELAQEFEAIGSMAPLILQPMQSAGQPLKTPRPSSGRTGIAAW